MISLPHPTPTPLVQVPGASSTTLDWINLAVGIAGVLLTVAGFWVAFVQIRKTTTAAEAAEAAATAGTSRIRYNQLMMLLPQMQSLEGEMDTAAQMNEPYAAERVLLRWRQLATMAHGVLGSMGSTYSELVKGIDRTRNTAINVKGRLAEMDDQTTVAVLTSGARKEISNVNDRLGSVVGKLATELSDKETAE